LRRRTWAGAALCSKERFPMNLSEMFSGLRGSDALNRAAGQAGLEPDQAHEAVQTAVEHVAGGGAITEVVGVVASKVGISPEQVQALLPQVLPLLQGRDAAAGGEESQGGLGGLLGRLGGLFR
jgi:hypothetical protein